MGKYKIYDFLGGFKIPITQEYGNDISYYKQLTLNPATGKSTLVNGHEGVDFGALTGTKLYCPFDKGIIVREGIDIPGWKNYGVLTVIYDPMQSCALWFCHLEKFLFNINDVINKGDVFAITDNTGNTRGEHVHVNFCETDKNGIRLNQDNGSLGFLNLMDPNLVEWLPSFFAIPSPSKSPQAPQVAENQQVSIPVTILATEQVSDYIGIKKSDFMNLRTKCDKYDPILAAGYPDIASIDEKLQAMIQERADAQKGYEDALAKANATSIDLATENQDLVRQKADILSKWEADTKKDSPTLQAGVDAMGKVKELESSMRTISNAAGAKKPTEFFILSKLDEIFAKFDYFKRKAVKADEEKIVLFPPKVASPSDPSKVLLKTLGLTTSLAVFFISIYYIVEALL